MKTLKKVSIIVILTIAIMLLTVVLLVKTGNMASAINKNKEPLPEVEYIINGETVTGNVTVERGTYISIVINYDDEKYIPELFTETDSFAYQIIGNELSILPDSRIGGELLLYAIIIKDGIEIILDPIAIVPVWESNFGEKIVSEANGDGYQITFADDNIISVKTSISMQDGGKTAKVLSNGDGIEDVINISKHGYAGLTLDFEEITVNTVDNANNVSVQTVTNGLDNLQVSAYATRGLSGSGNFIFPYKIYSASDIGLIPSYDGSSIYFKQMNNITIDGGTAWQDSDFQGHYNGKTNTIYVYGINGDSSVLCRYNYGLIRNLTLDIREITTLSGTYTGIVAVKNYGTIYNVKVTTYNYQYPSSDFLERISGIYAPIKTGASLNFGSIAAANYGSIYDCNATIHTLSNFFIGGIVGLNLNGGSVTTCKSELSVLGSQLSVLSLIGGIAGKNNSGGILNNNEGRTLLVYFSITSSNTSVPKIGGVCGGNYSSSSLVYSNVRNSDYAFNVEGYPILLTSAQTVNINDVYGYWGA